MTKPADDRAAETRRTVLETRLSAGSTVRELMSDDVGRAAILPELLRQAGLANRADDPDGYAVINGDPIPDSLLGRPRAVPRGLGVILASDGFEAILDTLHESSEAMARLYREDPLRIGRSWAGAATKGLADEGEGAMHDDRTWLRVPLLR